MLPTTTNGAPCVLIVACASVLKVNNQLPPTKLTVSWVPGVPTKSMKPITREPTMLVIVSGPPANWITGLLASAMTPLMIPVLVSVELPVFALNRTPGNPDVLLAATSPELFSVALPLPLATARMLLVLPLLLTMALPAPDVTAWMPNPLALMLLPELFTLALPAPDATAWIPSVLLPELFTVALPVAAVAISPTPPPTSVPELVTVALPLPLAVAWTPPALLPELTAVASPPFSVTA